MTLVVVTGLAAAGKTTLARSLAAALDLPLLSKDAIMEALFDAVGIGDAGWAKTVSRAADDVLLRLAGSLDAAVLDNYWYVETIERLATASGGPFVEVFCRCDPAVAAARFAARERHAGHADADYDPTSFERAASRFPFGTLGPVVEVDGEGEGDIASLAAQIRAHEVAA